MFDCLDDYQSDIIWYVNSLTISMFPQQNRCQDLKIELR